MNTKFFFIKYRYVITKFGIPMQKNQLVISQSDICLQSKNLQKKKSMLQNRDTALVTVA